MTLDMTSLDDALKQYYPSDKINILTYKKNPLLAMIPKDPKAGGYNFRVPIGVANPQGVSAVLSRANARATASASTFRAFDLDTVNKYGVAKIANKAIAASKGQDKAFIGALTSEVDGILNQTARNLGIGIYRGGWGKVGVVNQTSFGVATLQLATVSDIHNFEKDQELVVAAAESTGNIKTVGSSGLGLIVTGVDRKLGRLTFAANVNDGTSGIPTIANGDTIFIRGDRDESGSPTKVSVSGLQAWVPEVAPSTSENFFSVDRSIDSRLYGQFIDYTAWPLQEALQDADAQVDLFGGALSHFFMHPLKYSELVKSLGSKVQYVDVKSTNPQVGFKGVEIIGMNGPIKIVPDRNCPFDRCFGLQLDTWKLYSMGEHLFIDPQVNGAWAVPDEDNVAVRVKMYGQVGCSAPGWNIQMAI